MAQILNRFRFCDPEHIENEEIELKWYCFQNLFNGFLFLLDFFENMEPEWSSAELNLGFRL